MKLVKIGDTHRILYVAKNFTTGLTNVTGSSIDPSGSSTVIAWHGSDPTAGFCELAGGVYYHDWDATGKTAGKWVFTADSATQSNKGAESIQVITEGTLNDTIFETLDSNIDSIKTDIESGVHGLSQIQSELAVVDTNVDDIEALSVGANGFAAIKGAVDAIQSSVGGIGNSTRNTWLANTPVVIPDAGSINRRVWMNVFNTSGTMEDPDDQDIEVTVYDEAGSDVTSSYLAGGAPQLMTRSALGQYYIDFTIENTDTPIQLRFHHEYDEDSQTLVRDGIVDVVGALAGDLENKLDTIETKVDIVDTVVDGLAVDLSSISGQISTVDTVVDGIQADLDNGSDGLGAIKSAVDANQTDLTNIEAKVDTIDGIVDTINTNTDTIESSLTTIDGIVDDILVDTGTTLPATLATMEGKIDTVDTVVDGIQTDLSNATDGLGAIKAAVDTIDGIVDTINTNTDGIESTLGTPAGASMSADIAAIQSDIDGLEVDVSPGGYMI